MGGLGPHAHVEFETLLLSATEKKLGPGIADQDYPPWILSSLSGTPDRTRALLEDGPSPVDALVTSAGRLSAAGADFGVIPCNSAHAFIGELRQRVELPILDMIQQTAARAVDAVGPTGTIGILAASGTLAVELYPAWIRRLAPAARSLSLLDLPGGDDLQERLVMEPIFGARVDGHGRRSGGGIKSGAHRYPRRKEQLAEPMREAARRLADKGAEVVLTACTEIPLVLGRSDVDGIPLLDPMEVAAEDAVAIALGQLEIPSPVPV
jgi:aspartate racemase